MIKVFSAFGKVKRADIKARVYRATTGKWEDLGIITSTDRFWKIKKFIWKVVNYVRRK